MEENKSPLRKEVIDYFSKRIGKLKESINCIERTYTVGQIFDEIKKGSAFGRQAYNAMEWMYDNYVEGNPSPNPEGLAKKLCETVERDNKGKRS
jgi:hypothetical protein